MVLRTKPAVIFIWDNINWLRKVSQSRSDNKAEMINATTRTLVVPRHVDPDLDRNPNPRLVRDLNSKDILPTMDDRIVLFERRVRFVAKFMIEVFPDLKHLKDRIPSEWQPKSPHPAEKTQIIPLPLLHFDEGTIKGTLDVFDQTAKDLNLDKNLQHSLLCAGDQSSCRNARGAKMQRLEQAENGDWLGGLQWVLEWPQHFHCQLAYLRVSAFFAEFIINLSSHLSNPADDIPRLLWL